MGHIRARGVAVAASPPATAAAAKTACRRRRPPLGEALTHVVALLSLLALLSPADGYVKSCTHGSDSAFNPSNCNCTLWCDPVGGVPHGYNVSLPNM